MTPAGFLRASRLSTPITLRDAAALLEIPQCALWAIREAGILTSFPAPDDGRRPDGRRRVVLDRGEVLRFRAWREAHPERFGKPSVPGAVWVRRQRGERGEK